MCRHLKIYILTYLAATDIFILLRKRMAVQIGLWKGKHAKQSLLKKGSVSLFSNGTHSFHDFCTIPSIFLCPIVLSSRSSCVLIHVVPSLAAVSSPNASLSVVLPVVALAEWASSGTVSLASNFPFSSPISIISPFSLSFCVTSSSLEVFSPKSFSHHGVSSIMTSFPLLSSPHNVVSTRCSSSSMSSRPIPSKFSSSTPPKVISRVRTRRKTASVVIIIITPHLCQLPDIWSIQRNIWFYKNIWIRFYNIIDLIWIELIYWLIY